MTLKKESSPKAQLKCREEGENKLVKLLPKPTILSMPPDSH